MQILIDNTIDIWEKIDYVHLNPVRAGIVAEIDEYIYSSARDYRGQKGLVVVVVIN